MLDSCILSGAIGGKGVGVSGAGRDDQVVLGAVQILAESGDSGIRADGAR